jgi:hypothetical protein
VDHALSLGGSVNQGNTNSSNTFLGCNLNVADVDSGCVLIPEA